MDIGHLHLHVRDLRRASSFYRRWFGLELLREDDGIAFLVGSRAFLLALMANGDPAPPPAWLHFGVPLPSAAEVLDLLARMEAAAVPIAKPLFEEPTFMSFRCRDPDGYAIELYWDGGAVDPASTAPRPS
jgi:catechol 2,3-dioxygenase-like lactoylglutathione lyase family enzyme